MAGHVEKFQTHSEEETIRAAQDFSRGLSVGDVVCLYGDLGMGKSVFSRAVIRALMNLSDMEVPSPTFTLVQNYETHKGVIWHFDLYRLSDPSEVYEIGWEEALAGGILLVEWPDRLGSLKPPSTIDIIISSDHNDPNLRQIEVRTP